MPFTNLLITLGLILSLNVWGQMNPKFLTKQSIESLRFISSDGKYTYYQTQSGILNLTTNYDNRSVLESKKGTIYYVHPSTDEKNILVEMVERYHSNFSLMQNHELYIGETGGAKPVKIASGRQPTFSLDNSWLGYYTSIDKTIHFTPLKGKQKDITIALTNRINDFFLPQFAMFAPDSILYTDLNEKGHMALLYFNSQDRQFKTVYKSKFPGSKIDFCLSGDKIILGEFSIDDSDKGSSITSVALFNNKDFQKQNIIYRSENADIGNILCDQNDIYFIKTMQYNARLNSRKTEVAKLSLATNEIKIVSDLESVLHIIKMGNRILAPHRQQYFIIKGDHDATKQDALGSK